MNPDRYFMLAGIIFNICTYVALVWRNKRRETLQQGQNDWKLSAMWEDYKERKHIRAKNGGNQ